MARLQWILGSFAGTQVAGKLTVDDHAVRAQPVHSSFAVALEQDDGGVRSIEGPELRRSVRRSPLSGDKEPRDEKAESRDNRSDHEDFGHRASTDDRFTYPRFT